MPLGVSLQLFDAATQQASLTGIQALWWDVTEPKDASHPAGRSAVVTTDATGYISLDLSDVSGLTAGASGFLALYRLDATNHQDSRIFYGKVATSTVTSGVKLTASTWVRDPSWLALPVVADTEQKAVGLYRINPDSNFVAVNCAGAYTVNWGDGSAAVNVATGVTAEYEYSFADVDFAGTNGPVTFTDIGDLVNRTAHGQASGAVVRFYDIVSTTGLTEGQEYYVVSPTANTFQVSATLGGAAVALTTNGSANLLPYKQAIITITPQGAGNLTSINFNVRHSATTIVYSTGWLDLLVSGTLLSTLAVSAPAQDVRWGYLEQFQLISANSVTNFSSMLSSCFSLVSIPLLNTAAGTNFTSMFSSCYALASIPLLNTAAGTTFASMLNSCYSLVSIPLLNTAAGTNFTSMFSSCYSLVSIPLLNTAAGTTFTSMFSSCYALASIPLLNTAAGTTFASMLNNCFSLASIPLLNTAAGTNFSSMFNNCYSLASIPLLNTAAGTTFASMFSSCYSLASGTLANTARTISYASGKWSAAKLDAIYTALRYVGTGACTFQIAGDTCTKVSHGMVEGQPTSFSAITTTTGIVITTVYYVRNPTADTFRLSATATGAIIDLLTGDGTGTFSEQTIAVTGNYGVATDTPTIASNKGWTVTG